PAISTGVYRFPLNRAARIAVATVADELARDRGSIEKVIFCTFGAAATDAYRAALTALVE
ncbi:MAG: O-acetyl-ADP-ribose deacetylase, partial [Alphaproteobacteria bacterium]|nr:O-acetyl-ADP-ribose deacetylase [Alphaproteobacteria bacterium]